MSAPRSPQPGRLVLSVLAARWEAFWPALRPRLEEAFGPVDDESPLLPFDHTGYYDAELGSPVTRRLLSFSRLVPLDALADLKLATNAWERELARADGRRVCNLDPGLLTLERLVLASGKNFTHRVYLGRGIWADLTLIYNKKTGWVDLPWTFPDYATPEMKERLTKLRSLYKNAIESAQAGTSPNAPAQGD